VRWGKRKDDTKVATESVIEKEKGSKLEERGKESIRERKGERKILRKRKTAKGNGTKERERERKKLRKKNERE
jgi:hypothetical protein